MFFSGKITHSVYTYLVRKGIEPAEIYQLTDLSDEFLKDPTSWLDAKVVEAFLQAVESKFSGILSEDHLLQSIGHNSKELKAWGVLDSVLRMIERPQDAFTQPQRFVSYFISPAPPIANFVKTQDSVKFDLPISFEEYPNVCGYLVAAFESLPKFLGGEFAEVQWRSTKISISWSQQQASFTAGEVQTRVLAPQFMEDLMETLEKTEKALEEKSRELERIKQENSMAAQSQTQDLERWFRMYRSFNRYSQEVSKLKDYFTRSQQLITLLIGQERSNTQVKAAMKRVNWEGVKEQFPEVIEALLTDFELERKGLDPEAKHVQNKKDLFTADTGQSWLTHP